MVTREFLLARSGNLSTDPARWSFSFPTTETEAALRESLAAHGQLAPLAVVREGDALVIADGARRLAILLELGAKEVQVVVLPPERLWDEVLALRLALGGRLNAVECGLYLKKRFADTGESFREMAPALFPLLGLAPREGAARDPLWLADLPREDAFAFASGELSTSGVRVLASAPREDALAAVKALRGFRLGANKFAEAARLILECAWREGVPVEKWLERAALPTPGEGAEPLREALKRLRYPKVTALAESFASDAASLPLPPRALLSHSPGFEGGRLRLTLAFATVGELARDAAAVARAAGTGEFELLERYLD